MSKFLTVSHASKGICCLLVLLMATACAPKDDARGSAAADKATAGSPDSGEDSRTTGATTAKSKAAVPSGVIDTLAQSPDEYLSKLAAKGKFNGAVLLARDHELVFQKAYGFQDIDSKKKMSVDSCFNLASISKPITATAVLMLADAGKLALGDEVTKYLPDLGYDGVTIEHLLTHTSGLPDYIGLAQEHWDSDKPLGNQDVVKLLSKHGGEFHFDPGSKYEYSNSGYALLALIVEKASGQTYPAFLESKIFEPLGMTSSFVLTPSTIRRKDACRVYAYSREKKKLVPDDISYLEGVYGDGGIFATAADLFRFDQALYEGRLLRPATLKKAFKAHKIKGKSTDYGYGWDVGEGYVSHTGSWEGFQNQITRYVDAGDSTIILTSVDNGNNDKVQDRLDASLRDE